MEEGEKGNFKVHFSTDFLNKQETQRTPVNNSCINQFACVISTGSVKSNT